MAEGRGQNREKGDGGRQMADGKWQIGPFAICHLPSSPPVLAQNRLLSLVIKIGQCIENR
jgi:hypothetical protein